MDKKQFQEKVAIVTGSGSGIGKSIALLLASSGCRGIVINDINKENAEETVAQVRALGSEAVVAIEDVSTTEGAQKTIATASQTWNQLDCLVNNAGICRRGDIWNESEDQFVKMMYINLYSTFLCLKYASLVMKEQKSGSIVNISSTAGITGGTMGPSYGATKGAIIALSKHSARSLAKFNIRVNCVAPGYIDTKLMQDVFQDKSLQEERWSAVPLGRLGSSEEVANAVIFLLSENASFITGDVMLISGGRTS